MTTAPRIPVHLAHEGVRPRGPRLVRRARVLFRRHLAAPAGALGFLLILIVIISVDHARAADLPALLGLLALGAALCTASLRAMPGGVKAHLHQGPGDWQ